MAARQKTTSRTRLIVSGSAFAFALLMLWGMQGARQWSGPFVFGILAWVGLAFCLFEGLRLTAGSLCTERREGTLGLLFLTNLRPREVILGKLAAAAVNSGTVLLALLPAFWLPMLTGGVTRAAFAGMAVSLVILLAISLAAGLLVSSVTTSSFAAAGGTFVLVVAAMLGPSLWNLAFGDAFTLRGPWEMFYMAFTNEVERTPQAFGMAGATSGALFLVLIGGASVLLGRFWRAQPQDDAERWWVRFSRPRTGYSEGYGGAAADQNPSVWLAERTLPGRRALWMLVGIACAICLVVAQFFSEAAPSVVIALQVALGILLKLWAALIAPQSINHAVRSGALELILCTPVSPRQIVQGQMDALRGYFLAPSLAVAVGLPVAGLVGALIRLPFSSSEMEISDVFGIAVPWGVFWVLLFLLDLHALGYVGLWNGLTQARPERAAARTAFAVLVLPWITLMLIPLLGFLGLLAWPIFWILWASRRLETRFRVEVANRYSGS